MSTDKAFRNKNLETDIVVIGGGGTGLAAAVAAAEKGTKVILLEKRGLGGNSAMANSFAAADSHIQKMLNISAPKDDVYRYAVEYSHYSINQRLFRAFINKSGDTVKWLEDKGLHIARIGDEGVFRTAHHPEKGGAEVVKILQEQCEKLGVQIFTQTPAKQLVLDKNGKIAGVLAQSKGREYRINCKSIIISTGGYAGNKELLRKYYPGYNENMHNDGVPNMGDGLLMAMEIGVDTEGLGKLLIHPHIYPGVWALSMLARRPNTIWVNKNGERFADETVGLIAPEDGNAVARQPDKVIYVLFDDKWKSNMISEWRPPPSGFMSDVTLSNLDSVLQTEMNKGGVMISRSWREIGNWIGASPEVLENTVQEYNYYCDHGYDDVFLKNRKYLQDMRTPPYYGIRCYLSFLTTIGGIKINHKMEVLKGDKPFPGLFAGGDSVGGWQSDTYCMNFPSSAFGFALNSGRIAGENAADYVKLTRK
jgi:fumarate reductase flavoprotein subunit